MQPKNKIQLFQPSFFKGYDSKGKLIKDTNRRTKDNNRRAVNQIFQNIAPKCNIWRMIGSFKNISNNFES